MKKWTSTILALCMVLGIVCGIVPTNVEATENIVINGVDIGYAAGDYFSTTGKECTCHGRKTCGEASDCTCILVSGCCQCYGFALWCENKLFDANDVANPSKFESLGSIAAGSLTEENLKEYITAAPIGSHIRTNKSEHSMILYSKNENGFTVVQANGSNNNEYENHENCRIGTATYTWEEYVNCGYGKRGIEFIKFPVGTYDYLLNPVIQSPDASNTYSTGESITFSWKAVNNATSYQIGVKDMTTGENLTAKALGREDNEDNQITSTSCTLDSSYITAGHEIR